jgi:uncharacterized protein (UPF0332 family)
MKDGETLVLIRYRLEQADESLKDAKTLLDGIRSPRSIINRSYYAMFYAVLALLQKVGKVPRKHSGAISLFDTEFVRKGLFAKELSKDLHAIFNLRQVSDYQIIEPVTLEEAETALKKAEYFVEAVRIHLVPVKNEKKA